MQHVPPAALIHPAYIPTALAGAAVAFVVHIKHRAWDRVFILVDAAAISLWATAGALITLGDGLNWLSAVLLGTITATGGGITRDVIVQRTPVVFTAGPLYATVAIFVPAIAVICAQTLGPHNGVGVAVAISAGIALRLLAYWRGWRLPRGLDWKPSLIVQRASRLPEPGDQG